MALSPEIDLISCVADCHSPTCFGDSHHLRLNAGHYGFMLTAIDGRLPGGGGQDRFRIKIWDVATGVIIYDNQPASDDDAALNDATILRGGSIVIHRK